MNHGEQYLESLAALRTFVTEALCEHEHLEPGAFPLTERFLHRLGRPCAVQFCLHGPRMVRLVAIWETEKHSVLFYDSTGERFDRVQLTGLMDRRPKISAEELPA